jgi:hypothetical protein
VDTDPSRLFICPQIFPRKSADKRRSHEMLRNECEQINLLVSLCSSSKRYIANAFITTHARTHTRRHKGRINLSFSFSKKSVLATNMSPNSYFTYGARSKKKNTRWFKYYRDYLCVNNSQFVPVIFEPPCKS